MTTRWGGGRSALLLAALLPAACVRTYEFDSSGGGGGVNGSDAGPVGGGNGVDGGGGNSDAKLHCSGSTTVTTLSSSPANPAIMFALDRSHSMLTGLGGNGGSRFSVTGKAIIDTVNAYSAIVSFGYVEFPTGDSSCSGMCCAGGLVPPAPLNSNSSAISMALNTCASSQSLTCNGSTDVVPTGQALNKIANTFKHNTTNSLYALLLTDGPPTSNCPLDPTQPDDACDQANVLMSDMSKGNLSPSPITTFVIGIGDVAPDPMTTPPANNCLNRLAFSGGHPAPTSPFYALATTDTSVRAQIDTIVTNAICQVDIDDQFFDPNHPFQVFDVNGSMILPDPMNGWTLDPNKSRLTFTGSSCANLITALKTTSHHPISVKACIDPLHPFQPQPNP